MTKPVLTDRQKEAVGLIGRDICVTAGAGSGKTRVLVERFIHLVKEKKVPIQDILTITFTEKAANEMKRRVADRFAGMGLMQEMQDIEFAYLSTIDGFAARLLREYALEADVDPEFTVLDEYESRYLMRRQAETLLAEWEASNPADFTLLLKNLHCRNLEDAAVNITGKIRSTGIKPKNMSCEDTTSDRIKEIAEQMSHRLNEIGSLSEQERVSPTVLKRLRMLTSELFPVVNMVISSPEKLALKHIDGVAEAFKRYGRLPGRGAEKELIKELRDVLSKELRMLFFQRESVDVENALNRFLTQLTEKYEEEKRSRSALDFYDLSEKVIGLLQTAPLVQEELRGKFRYILVDEFQDTNNLQKTLIDLLRSEGNLFVVGDARQSIYGFRNADLGVFLGHREDVKENGGAVIRLDENFRTRPEIIDFINHVFNSFPEGGGVVERSELKAASSFGEKDIPSVELILTRGDNADAARRREAAVLAGRIHDIVEDGEVRITRRGAEGEESPVSYGDFAILLRSTSDIKLYERALAELNIPFFVTRGRGLYNTREITDLINFIKVIDNPLDEIKLAAVLRSPFVGVSDECLFWLAHYSKDKNGKELFDAVGHAGEIPEIEPHHQDRLLRFADRLGRFRELRERLSIGSLMDAVIEETGFDTRMLALPSGRQKYANIKKIVELSRGLEKKGFSGLNEFFRVITDFRLRETRESEAPTDVERSDVVKLMTIHAAKGLEFPVVAVADLNRRNRNHTDDLAFSRKAGPGFKALNPLTGESEKTYSYHRAVEEQSQRELEERERIFYVALTRAEEHLLLSGALGPGSNGEWLRILIENLNLPPEPVNLPESITFGDNNRTLRIITGGVQHRARSSLKRLSVQDRQRVTAGRRLSVPADAGLSGSGVPPLMHGIPAAATGDYVYSVTEIMTFTLCPRLYYLKHRLGLPAINVKSAETAPVGEMEAGKNPSGNYVDGTPRSGRAGAPGRKRNGSEESYNSENSSAASLPRNGVVQTFSDASDEIGRDVLGSIAHAVLERYRPAPGGEHLRETILQVFDEVSIREPTQGQVEGVARWVTDFYSSDVGRMVETSERVERELPFIFNYKGNPVRGKIDLLFSPDGTEWHLLDYKSSSAVGGGTGGYEFQMRLYSLAVEAIYGRKPEKAILFFIAAKEAVGVDISPDAMKNFTANELDPFFLEQGAGNFMEQRGPHCEWCEYHNYCDGAAA